jgi:hypothetical protein
MIAEGVTLTQKIQQDILELPQESLPELEQSIESPRFKAQPRKTRIKEATPEYDPTDAIRLDGLFKGYEFSPKFIAEARREMWRKHYAEIE